MKQIIDTTDGKFIGLIFDPVEPLILDGVPFVPDTIKTDSSGFTRYANSNYVIDTKEI